MEVRLLFVSLLFVGCRGIVNLACGYPRGKVAIKARSARTTSRLYVGFLLRGNPGLILQDSFS
jgi:hypothetical protein